MKKKVMKKKEWVAPQCKVYGDVQELTLTDPPGPVPGGGRPAGDKTCGCADCCRHCS